MFTELLSPSLSRRAVLYYLKLCNAKFILFNICSKIVCKSSDLTENNGNFAIDPSTMRRPSISSDKAVSHYGGALESRLRSMLNCVVDESKNSTFL